MNMFFFFLRNKYNQTAVSGEIVRIVATVEVGLQLASGTAKRLQRLSKKVEWRWLIKTGEATVISHKA